MQLLKSVVLLGLLAAQSLAEPIPKFRRGQNSAVKNYLAARDSLDIQKRADPSDWVPGPTGATWVDMSSYGSAKDGEALATDGLSTCIAVVAVNKNIQDDDDHDKWLAHISAVNWESQLNAFYEVMDLSDPRIFIIPPNPDHVDADRDFQDRWNQEVVKHIGNQWSDYNPLVYIRDSKRTNEKGGGRLWITTDNVVKYGVNGETIQQFLPRL